MNVKVIDHPILQHKLSYLRDKNTSSQEFRRIVKEASELMAYEATRDCVLTDTIVETSRGQAGAKRVLENLILVGILRSGSIMLDGMLEVLPFAKVGHIGIYKDRFIDHTVEYYFKLPETADVKHVILLDPVLASGSTLISAIERLYQYGVEDITVVTFIACKSGLDKLAAKFDKIKLVTLSIEDQINDQGMLVPGIGDVSDRLFS